MRDDDGQYPWYPGPIPVHNNSDAMMLICSILGGPLGAILILWWFS